MLRAEETRFWQAVLQTGLVDAAHLEACWEEVPTEKRTPDAAERRLARRLVDAGHLTRWQAQQLLAGLRPQALRHDRYVLLDILGQGGMGRVFLAKDTRLQRKVALKVLSRERMSNPRALARFRREARVGAQLQHENLVRIYDEGEVNGNLFLVMEFIEGKALGKLLVERGPLMVPIATRIARQIALGLQHAHEKELVHRDVNPMNVILDRAGNAKLTDLGLALDLAEEAEPVTRDGATVGTFDYISPEQARSSRQINIQTDIYSLGCTFYHMVSGRPPFQHPSLPEKLYAHQMLEPDPLTELVQGFPGELWATIARMMAKQPAVRFSTPREVVEALRPFEGPALTLAEIESSPRVALLETPPAVRRPGPSPAAAAPLAPSRTKVVSGGPGLAMTPQSGVTAAAEPRGNTGTDGTGSKVSSASDSALLGSDIFGALPRIDPADQPLTDTRSGAGRGARGRLDARRSAPLIAAVLAAIVFLVGLRFWPSGSGGGPIRSTNPDPITKPIARSPRVTPGGPSGLPRPPSRSRIMVRRLEDGTEEVALSLRDAIQRVVGRRAEVVLEGQEPLVLDGGAPLTIGGGTVTIRAAENANPTLKVEWNGQRPIFQVRTDGRLVLAGLRFECAPTAATPRTMLIQCGGDLMLDHCQFIATGRARDLRVALAAGGATTIRACEFRGIISPLEIESYARSEVALSQCLFVADALGADVPGWALTVEHHAFGVRPRKRRIIIDRCTVIGPGLVRLTNFEGAFPVEIETRATVVQSRALVAWEGTEAFPSGLNWVGSDNRYVISGKPWVVMGAAAVGAGAAPTDLPSWSQATRTEPGTEAGPDAARFSAIALDVPAERRPITAFTLTGADATAIGIDPARLER